MICKYCNKEMGNRFPTAGIKNGKKYTRKKCNVCYGQDKKRHRHRLRKKLDKIKSNYVCEICGFEDWRALQYHHKDGVDKSFELGNAVNRAKSIKKIKKEIEKCQCICANCHQILHHEERERESSSMVEL